MKVLNKKLAWTSLRFILVVGIFVYLYTTDQLDPDKLKLAFERTDLFAAGTVLIFLGALFAVQRWRLLLHAQNVFLSLWAAIKLTFVGFFFGIALPGTFSGDIVKAYFLAKGEQQKAALITSIFFDRLLGLYTLFFIATQAVIISFLYSAITEQYGVWSRPYVVSLGFFICISFVFLTVIGILSMSKKLRDSRVVKYIFTRVPFRETVSGIYDTIQQYRHNPRLTFNAFILSLVAQIITYAGMFCIALLLKITVLAPIDYLFVLPVGSLINAIPLAPSGLGIGEAGFRKIFLLFGSQEGAELAVIFHAIFFMLSLGFGGGVYLFSDLSKSKAGT